MKEKLNVALAGFGFGAQTFHAPYIHKSNVLNLYKILERNNSYSQEKYPECITVQKYEDIINDSNIDLVVIATPNKEHYPMAKIALESNKNVVIDKPFTIETHHADELIRLSEEKGLLLSIYHNKRFEGDFLTVKKVVESSILGEIVDYEAHADRFSNKLRSKPWKEKASKGVDLMYDIGSHMIDAALNLFGKPNEIYCDMRIQRDGSEVYDNFELILYYEKLKAVLKAGMIVKETQPAFTVHGKNGSFTKYSFNVEERNSIMSLNTINLLNPYEPREFWGKLNILCNGLNIYGNVETLNGSYMDFYENIYNVLKGDGNLIVSPYEARDVVKIMELAGMSNDSGKRIKCVL